MDLQPLYDVKGRLEAAAISGVSLLGEDFCVIEEGLGGRTSIYHRPDEPWLNGLPYFKPCLLSHRPLDLVVLMLGTNDRYIALCRKHWKEGRLSPDE